MIKQRFNKALLLLLSAAFLVFSWTPLHAHLNVQHNHDGMQHQHDVKAHAHQQVIFHADQIDSAHPQEDEAQVVNLGHDKSPQSSKQLDIQPVILADFVYCQLPPQTREFGLSDGCNSLPRPPPRQPGQPRAPPRLS